MWEVTLRREMMTHAADETGLRTAAMARGGAVLNVVAFAAAVVRRSMRQIRVPTTILA